MLAKFDTSRDLVSCSLQIILVEPFFDCYQPMAKIAGAKALFVPLRPVGGARCGVWAGHVAYLEL